MKPRIAIFDLTDCEGCELEFINLREKLTTTLGQTEVANWRLGSTNMDPGPFDITFIEGSPITETDIEIVKQARAVSRIVVSLGSCADLGGIQSSLESDARTKGLKLVYGEKYKSSGKVPRPISYYIEVDIHLPGCPINQNELADLLGSLLAGKKPTEARFPVCLECKAMENECLLLAGEACLGPVTKGGCEAVCPSKGLRCWGCFGALRGSNTAAMKHLLVEKFGEKRAKQLLANFYSQQDEFKALYLKEKK
jgi:coenzyme F420-reducing hydrogenase gamma subunit